MSVLSREHSPPSSIFHLPGAEWLLVPGSSCLPTRAFVSVKQNSNFQKLAKFPTGPRLGRRTSFPAFHSQHSKSEPLGKERWTLCGSERVFDTGPGTSPAHSGQLKRQQNHIKLFRLNCRTFTHILLTHISKYIH